MAAMTSARRSLSWHVQLRPLWLSASLLKACDVIGLLYATQLLIHSIVHSHLLKYRLRIEIDERFSIAIMCYKMNYFVKKRKPLNFTTSSNIKIIFRTAHLPT